MKRRNFLKSIGGSLTLSSLLITSSNAVAQKNEYKWKMVTSWPKNFPGLGVGAENLANLINKL